MPVVYDRNSSSFRGDKGRYISNAEVLRLVDAEVARQETKLKGHARLLVNGKIDIPEFQKRMATTMKASSIRMAALGAGGAEGLGNRHYGKLGSDLKKQYKFLAGFGNALASGLTEKQVLRRAEQYGRQSAIAFHAAQKITKESEGFTEGKRSLDGQSQHCTQCLDHSTNGQWVPISEIVPRGTNCDCGGRCRCLVLFRKGTLVDAVMAANTDQSRDTTAIAKDTRPAIDRIREVHQFRTGATGETNVREMDIKLYAAQLEKLEAIKNPTLAQQEHIKALLTKPDKQSSEAAMDRVDELQRYHRKILAGEKLDDRALLDLPDTFAQGLRGGSAQAVTNTAALYAAEIYRNLPENQKKKFVENWVESRGETVQENLGKIQGWKAATKPEIVKEFVDDVDRRLKKEYGLEPPAPIKSTKPAPKDPSGTADPFASLDAPPRKSLDPFASLDIPSKQPAKQEEVAPPKPKPDIKLSESEAIAARTFQKSFTDGTTYGDFGQRIYNNAIKEGLSKDEAGGLAAWLSNGYRDMGRAQRGAKAGDNVAGGEDGVRGAIKNAENALQKLKPVTQSQLESRGQPVGELSRFIQVENPAEFIRSYGASIGKTIKQEGFFGTSTQSGDSPGMELYSSRANITYKITPNLRGDGQGRYVDHLKGWKKDQEGEILYPPGSSFKVTKIKNALSPAETSEWDSLEAAGGRMAALKAGMAVYTRYQALAKKANNYTVHLEEY